MKRKKYRYHKYSSRLINELNRLTKEYSLKKIESSKIESNEIILTEADRITHIRRVDSKRTSLEVINVSYETKVDDEWITIVRYDSTHGFLHRHLRVSLDDPKEIINTIGVKKKGTIHVWYTWAIKDILSRYTDYKRAFMKRSKVI
ncbi:MAG: hypothetical protein Q8O68_00245 [Candidatus Daviesbacteria bacterium]|nr:hypothetical protein [Candidatus Daviesbacteria bacterium]